ncbi:MAG: RtcB family protein [Patescibacteria group bacterium]
MLFSCDNIEHPEIRGKLGRITRVHSLARPPVCLPNIHPKAGLESPPQFVAATKDTIVPQLTAPAMNCGMSVFRTTLKKEDFSPEFLKDFATRLRAGVLPRESRFKGFLAWLGTYEKPSTKYDLTREELRQFFLEGAPAAARKYGIDAEELAHMEYGGNIISNAEKKEIDLGDIVPRSSWTNGRHEIGYNFGGNHFLELHTVEKIDKPEIASAWNIAEGDILIFYHGGGGHATYHLGRYFGRREKNAPLEKLALFFLKLMFHFAAPEGIKHFGARWHAYFSRTPFPETPINSPEGKRLWQSIRIGLNYGYAFRLALLKRINDALPKGKAHFVWDAAHNSIMKETIDGQELVVHRQDAMRVFTGKPVMIAGDVGTLSCLAVGGDAEESLWSATPSAAKEIGEYIKDGKSQKITPAQYTLVSKRKEQDLIKKEHYTSEGLYAVVDELKKSGSIEPVAWLKPLGGIKGH